MMHNNMQITANWSRSKSEVKFQYGGRLYFETGSSYISDAIWDISTKFGLLILWPSEGSHIKKYETGSSIQRSPLSSWAHQVYNEPLATISSYCLCLQLCHPTNVCSLFSSYSTLILFNFSDKARQSNTKRAYQMQIYDNDTYTHIRHILRPFLQVHPGQPCSPLKEDTGANNGFLQSYMPLMSAPTVSSSFTTRFWLHSSSWPRPFAGSNAVVRSELRPTCLHHQCIQFLLVTSTSAISAFTWHRICGHTRTFVRRVAHWLL